MRNRAMFIGGLAVGFVLGARAGRERYEQMKTLARRATDNPAVQQAAGAAAAQATGLAKTASNKVADKVQQRAPGLAGTARKASERLPGWRDKQAGTGAEPGAGTDESGAGTDGVPSVPAPGGPADG
jgi:hypothetical protein